VFFTTAMLYDRTVKAQSQIYGEYISQEVLNSGTSGLGATATKAAGEVRGFSCATDTRHGDVECFVLVKK